MDHCSDHYCVDFLFPYCYVFGHVHQEFVTIYKDFVQIKFFSTVKINTVAISKVSNTFFGFLKPADQHRDTHVVSFGAGTKSHIYA